MAPAPILPQKSVANMSAHNHNQSHHNQYPAHAQQSNQQSQHHHHSDHPHTYNQQHTNHQQVKHEPMDLSLPQQLDNALRIHNQYPPQYQRQYQPMEHQQQQNQQQQHQGQEQQSYRGHPRFNGNEDEDDDDLDDDEDDLDEEELQSSRFHSAYNTAYNTAYNSAYNSCDEGDDVNMDGVSLKEEDQDMCEPPSASAAASAFSFHSTGASVQAQHHRQHALPHSVLASSSSSASSSAAVTPITSPSTSSSKKTGAAPAPSTTANVPIKPRPALRPILPSRPTSPQPMIQARSGASSANGGGSDPNMASGQQKNNMSMFGSTNTSANNTTGKTRSSAYKINGLNILNRNSLDSRTALEMIRRRRENHNHVERRRRDTLNSTILQIADILPNCSSTAKLNKGTILRLALDHLRVSLSFVLLPLLSACIL